MSVSDTCLHAGVLLKKCDDPLSFPFDEVIERGVGLTGHVSLSQPTDDLLFRRGNFEAFERRRVPGNVLDAVDRKFDFAQGERHN